MEIKVKKLTELAKLPTRKYPHDAGMDFYSLEDVIIPISHGAILKTGIAVEIPMGYVLLLKPKGGSNYILGAGVIDQNYQGEIYVKIFNIGNNDLKINSHDAICQGIFVKNISPEIIESNDLYGETSERGTKGGIVEQVEKDEPPTEDDYYWTYSQPINNSDKEIEPESHLNESDIRKIIQEELDKLNRIEFTNDIKFNAEDLERTLNETIPEIEHKPIAEDVDMLAMKYALAFEKETPFDKMKSSIDKTEDKPYTNDNNDKDGCIAYD